MMILDSGLLFSGHHAVCYLSNTLTTIAFIRLVRLH